MTQKTKIYGLFKCKNKKIKNKANQERMLKNWRQRKLSKWKYEKVIVCDKHTNSTGTQNLIHISAKLCQFCVVL